MTTNAIATLAGVSIGTLYQYFEDREAIFAALAERHLDQIRAVASKGIGELMVAPLEQAIENLLETLIATHQINPRLDQALLRLAPLAEAGTIDEIEHFMTTMVTAALRLRPDLQLVDPEGAAMLLTAAVAGVIRATVRREPERLHDPAFLRGLVDLVLGFLDRQRGGPRST